MCPALTTAWIVTSSLVKLTNIKFLPEDLIAVTFPEMHQYMTD